MSTETKPQSSISVQNLCLNFGSTEVLRELNLDINEGEFLVLLGPSGCGKSTLLNCIAGLLDVTDGQVHIKGRNVTWEEPKDRGIGMVFQSYALYPQMSVKGNLSFGLKNARIAKREIEQRIKRTAEILQIESLLGRKPAALSGGQRQRVAIGRALIREVDVFLFDEPLSNLDAKLRSELRVEIKRLHQKLSNTMVYVTHDQIEALTLADRIAVMKGGVIQQLDKPLTIYNKPANLFVAGFIGSPAMNFLRGRLQQSDQGIEFSDGEVSIPLHGYDASTAELMPELDVFLGLRPEHMAIAASAPGRAEPGAVASLSAVVDLDEPMGADSLLWLKAGNQDFSVRVSSDQRYVAGDSVSLEINLAMASIFRADTGTRL